MDNQKYSDNSVRVLDLLHIWLVSHPNQIINHRDQQFVFDTSLQAFLYRKPKNKVRNGWQVFFHLNDNCWLKDYFDLCYKSPDLSGDK